jgi:hypothetical protein
VTTAHRRARAAARARRLAFTGVLASIVVATATCGGAPGPSPAAPPPEGSSASRAPAPEASGESRFRLAVRHIESDELEAAARELAELAERCESGPWGRNAILMLAALELNPHNASGSPSAGARLAARYLQVPGASAGSLAVAETLYLLAVDLGAEPVADPFENATDAVETALAFEDCDAIRETVVAREIPRHPGPATTRGALVRASAQRDSLAAVADSLTARAAELEAELDRIRRLLVPDSIGRGGHPQHPGP